jgi:hypothetical protein
MVEGDSAIEDLHRFGTDYDARAEMERLQRRLFEAMRQGNNEKIESIKRQLEVSPRAPLTNKAHLSVADRSVVPRLPLLASPGAQPHRGQVCAGAPSQRPPESVPSGAASAAGAVPGPRDLAAARGRGQEPAVGVVGVGHVRGAGLPQPPGTVLVLTSRLSNNSPTPAAAWCLNSLT